MIENVVVGGFNRVEVIDHRKTGTKISNLNAHRAFQAYGPDMQVMISTQDDGMTLKVFLSERESVESDDQTHSRRSP